MNRVIIPAGSELKTYYKYYGRSLRDIPEEKQEMLKHPLGTIGDGLEIDDRNDLFKEGYLPGEIGIFPLKAGGFCVANRTIFYGCKGEMLQWWFAWHGTDPLKYAIWDPYDHYDLIIPESEKHKLHDPSISNADKCREIHHTVKESLIPGDEPTEIEIFFRKPSVMGFEEKQIFTDHCSFLVCANVEIVTPEGVPNMPVVMTHMSRDIADGCELRSRFWLGYQIQEGNGVYLLPENMDIPLPLVTNLLQHNFFEFTNLAEILKSVYSEEKNNWE